MTESKHFFDHRDHPEGSSRLPVSHIEFPTLGILCNDRPLARFGFACGSCFVEVVIAGLVLRVGITGSIRRRLTQRRMCG